MGYFYYKTRKNTPTQGIPNVYFCCNKEDLSTYFDSISDEILSSQNCAIWYKAEDVEISDDFFDYLKQMQLFVIPVTRKFLETPDDSLTAEFEFAIENNIPVLPIMQERGLAELFNEKCGNIQYLDKCSIDVTAISYDEKLKNFLSSVLIGDELAEKIRKAFDAYVFLSYRKKDRQYAQKLMRLIHDNDVCRDIAIWYDEFLTPGEDFNDAITKMLKESDMFVLTVTPSVVEMVEDHNGNMQDNYVVRCEYPEARKAGKLIIPAEIVPTNREELSQKYTELPECTDANNPDKLSQTFIDAIEKLALQGNDRNHVHNFFIGLAYLGGVDVEVDHQRAYELIKSAADAGLPEAIEKLVFMYQNGEGVKRNYSTAIEWHTKLAEVYKKAYEEDPSDDNTIKLVDTYCNLGNRYRELTMINKAEEIYRLALPIVEKYDKRYNSRVTKGNIAYVFNLLAVTKSARGDYDEAEKNIDKVVELEKNSENDFKKLLHLINSGNIYNSNLKFEKAERTLLDVINLVGDTDLSDDEKNYLSAMAYQMLGNTYNANEKCIAVRKEAVTYFEKLSQNWISDYYVSIAYIDAQYWLLYNLVDKRKLDDAKEVLFNGYNFAKDLYKETKKPEVYSYLARFQFVIGRYYTEADDYVNAEKFLQASLSNFSALGETFYNSNKKHYGELRNGLGLMYYRSGQYGAAYYEFLQAYNIFSEFSKNEIIYVGWKALMCANITDTLWNVKNYKEAIKYAIEGYELRLWCLKNTEENIRDDCKLSARQVFNVYSKMGHIMKALSFRKKAKAELGYDAFFVN